MTFPPQTLRDAFVLGYGCGVLTGVALVLWLRSLRGARCDDSAPG